MDGAKIFLIVTFSLNIALALVGAWLKPQARCAHLHAALGWLTVIVAIVNGGQ